MATKNRKIIVADPPEAAEQAAPAVAPTVVANITELERACELPEIDASEGIHEPEVPEGAITHFMDEVQHIGGQIERRVMRIVADAAGVLHKMHCPGFGDGEQS